MGVVTEMAAMGKALWRREYPPFIYSPSPEFSGLPAFFYHDVEAQGFQKHADYLISNGYRTLNCTEACSASRENKLGFRRDVLLTFDDGLESLYRVVYPIVKKSSIKIVSYIVPAWVGRDGFVTWDQCREMHESGLVDFQSHSSDHSVTLFTRKNEAFLPMVGNLQASREAIESQLPGHAVEHFAFPSHKNGPLAWRALETAGFRSGAVGIRSTYRETTEGSSVLRLFRVNGDFLFCLPGSERQPAWRVLMKKMSHRLNGKSVYGAAG